MRRRGFQVILQYLIVLLFAVACIQAVVLVRLASSATSSHAIPDRLIGQYVGEVTMIVMRCGDGLLHGNESCDGNATNGSTCATMGHAGGSLTCTGCAWDTSTCTGEDLTDPVVDLLWPANNTNFTWRDVALGYTVVDAGASIANCELFLNGEQKKRNKRVNESTPQFFTVHGLDGNYSWQVNCTDTSTAANIGSSVVWNFRVIANNSDRDGDGVDDRYDTMIGTNSSINTSTLGNPVIAIDNAVSFGNLSGNLTVNITNSGIEIFRFVFPFGQATLNLSKLRIDIENQSQNFSQFEIGDLDLPTGVTKIVFMNKVDQEVSSVCIKDIANAVADDITTGCAGSNEVFLTCDGSSKNALSCAEVNGRFQISGLQHSAGKQMASSDTGGEDTTGRRKRTKVSAPDQSAQPALPIPRSVRPPLTPVVQKPKKSDLFDVEVTVLNADQRVMPGEEVLAEISLFYLGDERLQRRVDIGVYYALLDPEGVILEEKFETVGIDTKTTFLVSLRAPEQRGDHWFYTRITVGKEVAEAFDHFQILQLAHEQSPNRLLPDPFTIIIAFVLSIFLLIITHHQYLLQKQLAKNSIRLSDQDLLRLGELMSRRNRK